jgi:hypothetical protein
MINRRQDDRASCLARQSLNPPLPMEPQIHTPATWKGGHKSSVAGELKAGTVPGGGPRDPTEVRGRHDSVQKVLQIG